MGCCLGSPRTEKEVRHDEEELVVSDTRRGSDGGAGTGAAGSAGATGGGVSAAAATPALAAAAGGGSAASERRSPTAGPSSAAARRRSAMRKVFDGVLADEDQEAAKVQLPKSWEAFAQLLGADVEDPVVLVLVGDMHRRSQAEIQSMCIERDTFLAYCDACELGSPADLAALKPSLRACLSDAHSEQFRHTYTFAFDYIRENGTRNISTDDAVMYVQKKVGATDMRSPPPLPPLRYLFTAPHRYWQLLLKPVWPLLDKWLEFVQQQKHKLVTKDEWTMLLDLCRGGQAAFGMRDSGNATSSPAHESTINPHLWLAQTPTTPTRAVGRR